MDNTQRTGLVLEGGAMRGMFSMGVIDVLMEHDIRFDGGIGVSAGACFGCNYKSRQPGRALRYNLRFCRDKRYASVRNLLTTGDLYSVPFCYGAVPLRYDPFDGAAYDANPMEFYVVCTDVLTGKPVYKKLDTMGDDGFTWIRASASMPLASRIVEVGGYKLLDGGVADSIPLAWFESIGYTKNVVVLTQPKGFVKQPNRLLPVMRATMRQYPAFLAAVADRHERYNATLRYIDGRAAAGAAFVLQPAAALEIGAVERDPRQLRRVYDHGRAVAEQALPALQAFLAGE